MALIPSAQSQPQAAKVVHEAHTPHSSEELPQRVLAMFLAGFMFAGVDDCGGAV